MKNVFYYTTDIGIIGIAENGVGITNIFFSKNDDPGDLGRMNLKETTLIRDAGKQIDEYFKGERKIFELPLETKGTPFQKAAWEALLTIPYGETRSYKQMAEQVGSSKAYRAVGMANNRNPIAIVIPCHRVIGASGKLVGYGGGLHIKEYLLELESRSR